MYDTNDDWDDYYPSYGYQYHRPIHHNRGLRHYHQPNYYNNYYSYDNYQPFMYPTAHYPRLYNSFGVGYGYPRYGRYF